MSTRPEKRANGIEPRRSKRRRVPSARVDNPSDGDKPTSTAELSDFWATNHPGRPGFMLLQQSDSNGAGAPKEPLAVPPPPVPGAVPAVRGEQPISLDSPPRLSETKGNDSPPGGAQAKALGAEPPVIDDDDEGGDSKEGAETGKASQAQAPPPVHDPWLEADIVLDVVGDTSPKAAAAAAAATEARPPQLSFVKDDDNDEDSDNEGGEEEEGGSKPRREEGEDGEHSDGSDTSFSSALQAASGIIPAAHSTRKAVARPPGTWTTMMRVTTALQSTAPSGSGGGSGTPKPQPGSRSARQSKPSVSTPTPSTLALPREMADGELVDQQEIGHRFPRPTARHRFKGVKRVYDKFGGCSYRVRLEFGGKRQE